MHFRLKHIHAVRARLANGVTATYYYAWRGGPRLRGEPGSPEFISSYQAARNKQRLPDKRKFQSLVVAFRSSPEFTLNIGERTRSDYAKQLRKIESQFGSLPLDALNDPRITRVFREWRDKMSAAPRQADYAWTVLMRLLSWARGQGLTTYRPPERVERLYHSNRADKIWTDEQIAAFKAVAPYTLQSALLIALDTGQRQGDLLALPWGAYDGQWIRLQQSKTGRTVQVPVTRRLKELLDSMPKRSTIILTNSAGRPWRPNAFRAAWGEATRKAGVEDLTFHDLRGSAVTRLAEAECTVHEIATITGHSLRDVGAILDRYTSRTAKLASSAIAKLEKTIK